MTEPVRMPMPSVSRRVVGRYIQFIVLSLASCWVSARAQSFSEVFEIYGSLLMAPERALIGTFPQLQRIAKPLAGPGNTRGRWIQRDVFLRGEAFNTTFYIKNGLLQRIELDSTAPDVQCRSLTPWSSAITALEAWNGNESVKGQFAAGDNIQQSIHWSAGDVDVTAYLSVTTDACSTKLTFKKREIKDASEL